MPAASGSTFDFRELRKRRMSIHMSIKAHLSFECLRIRKSSASDFSNKFRARRVGKGNLSLRGVAAGGNHACALDGNSRAWCRHPLGSELCGERAWHTQPRYDDGQ
jgi:hypothetical protein